MITKIVFEGTVKRVYEETRGQRVNKYIVVENGSGKYPDVLRFSLKPGSAISVTEGLQVSVSAYLHGREWVNAQGVAMYFTDLNVDTVEVLNVAAPAVAAAQKPTTASDWQSLLALGASYGEDAVAVTSRCKATNPSKSSADYTAADWQAVAAAIVAAHTPAPAAPSEPAFEDDLPF